MVSLHLQKVDRKAANLSYLKGWNKQIFPTASPPQVHITALDKPKHTVYSAAQICSPLAAVRHLRVPVGFSLSRNTRLGPFSLFSFMNEKTKT